MHAGCAWPLALSGFLNRNHKPEMISNRMDYQLENLILHYVTESLIILFSTPFATGWCFRMRMRHTGFDRISIESLSCRF